MNIHICLHNSRGLINDSVVLKEKLENFGHSVVISICNENDITLFQNSENFDKQIFLEHIFPMQIKYSKCNVLIANPEMINRTDFTLIKDLQIDSVYCKSNIGYQILNRSFPNMNVKNILWHSLDMNINNIQPDFTQFLHVKGKSRFKNTQTLLNFWMKNPNLPLLNIVHHGDENINGYLEISEPFYVHSNIKIHQYKMKKEKLKFLMNTCGFHICCSSTEGYGHYINEARSVGAIVVTTQFPPMNSFLKEDYGVPIQVDSNDIDKIGFSSQCSIREEYLEKSINVCLKMSNKECKKQSEIGRKLFLENRIKFLAESI